MADRNVKTIFTQPSKTQQEFRREVNINTIIERSKRQGLPPNTQKQFFGDVTGVDFQMMQERILAANNAFMQLHPKIRRRFNNDPGELIDFITDEANYKEAVAIGLLKENKEAKADQTSTPLDVTGLSDTKIQN